MADYIALDFLLKSVLANAEFDVNDNVYWEGVSALFPRFTANQVGYIMFYCISKNLNKSYR